MAVPLCKLSRDSYTYRLPLIVQLTCAGWRRYSKKSKAARSTTESYLPLTLTEGDVSKVLYFDPKEAKQVFPHGLSSKLNIEMEAIGRGSWLLRKQTYDIISSLQQDNSSRAPKFLLYGSNGCGKSVCMSQVIHWCSRAGWIVIHVPNVFDWTHSHHQLRSSPRHPGLYEQPVDSVQWLKNFRSTNTQHLAQVKLTEPYVWTKMERSEVNDDLNAVIEVGLLKPNIATDVVAVVMKMVAEQQDRRVLLAVDGFNGCFNSTTLRVGKGDCVSPGQLGLVRTVLENVTRAQYPGGMVLSLSRTKMYRHSVHGYTPEKLLGREGCESVGDYRRVLVPNFQREEMDTWLTNSYKSKWISKEPSESMSSELWHLSSGNPAELSRLCRAI